MFVSDMAAVALTSSCRAKAAVAAFAVKLLQPDTYIPIIYEGFSV